MQTQAQPHVSAATLPAVEDGPSRSALIARFYLLSLIDRYVYRGRPSASPRFAARQAIAEALQRRDGFTTPIPARPLPEVEAATRPAFLEASQTYRRSVVLRGFARDMPAVQRWDLDYLRERLAGVQCGVCVQDAEVRLKSWDVRCDIVPMDMADYLSKLGEEGLYLNNSTEVFCKVPALLDDLDLGRLKVFCEPGSAWDELVATNIFVSGPQAFSSMHAAIGGNFFLQIAGRKRWTFIEPQYAPHLHALPITPFQAVFTAFGGSRSQALQGAGEDNPITRMPRYEVTLEPGDLLYNAPWWWHEVDNLDPMNIGCAIRHLTPPYRMPPTLQNNPIYGAASTYTTAHALATGHWIAQRVFGYQPPMRQVSNALHERLLNRGRGR